MLALATKSGSISIQFVQEKLLKNFDATCAYAMSAVLPKGRQMLKGHCNGANHIKRQKPFENTRSLSNLSFTEATDPLREQVCCRGSDSRLGKCMQRSVKLLKFQRNLWS